MIKKLCPFCAELMPAGELGAHVLRHKRAQGDMRTTRAWRKIRAQVVARDGNACVVCGATERLQVHHLEGWHDNAIEHLVTVCDPCHRAAHAHKVKIPSSAAASKPAVTPRPELF
jgi:5-methylcytosine-specific restriction endonuclease McrA